MIWAGSCEDMHTIELCKQQVLHLMDVILSFQLAVIAINVKASDLIAEEAWFTYSNFQQYL